ncbi:HAMP domain-containing protein [Edaphobacter sp. HDX4]|uniref:sensor histidine kinase n=1 Tax=Edaphobacter sp. HDX4 TaxID=2794064 RepID=UPI002FE5BE02
MSALGLFSFFYLQKALASSREKTLQKRTVRLVHFVNQQPLSSLPLSRLIYQFSLVSPENDLLGVADLHGHAIYRYQASTRDLPWPSTACEQPCFSMVSVSGHRMRVLQQVITLRGQQYRLTLAGQVDEHYTILRMVRNSYLISIPLLLFVSVAGGLLLAHRTLEPIDRMTRTAQTISIHDLRKRLPVPNTGDEIQRLATTWNELLSRLETAVLRLTQFTSDISHDLRTTLTVMLATAQVSVKRERSVAEYQQAMQTILAECEATTQLLDDLLAASRADACNQNIQLSLVPFSEVLEETCTAFRTRAEVKLQALETDIQQDCWILGNLSLLRRLITILVDNALKYTPEQGQIFVSLASDHAGTTLHVIDSGIGIASHEIEKIFDRFYRVDTSRNRDQGGSGLGLAIAKWIVEVHSGSIAAKSDAVTGSRFSVQFPVLNGQISLSPLQ